MPDAQARAVFLYNVIQDRPVRLRAFRNPPSTSAFALRVRFGLRWARAGICAREMAPDGLLNANP